MIKNGLKVRWNALKAFFKGNASFSFLVAAFVPYRFRPKIKKLFGKPFYALDVDEPFMSMAQIIMADQYKIGLAKGTIVDAGANIGAFSVFAAVKHPDSTILAFEPAPETFTLLQKNIASYPNIQAFNCGLGEAEGTKNLEIMQQSGCNHMTDTDSEWRFTSSVLRTESVPIKTMDSLNREINFIKIDTEGYEAEILKGGGRNHKEIEAGHSHERLPQTRRLHGTAETFELDRPL